MEPSAGLGEGSGRQVSPAPQGPLRTRDPGLTLNWTRASSVMPSHCHPRPGLNMASTHFITGDPPQGTHGPMRVAGGPRVSQTRQGRQTFRRLNV